MQRPTRKDRQGRNFRRSRLSQAQAAGLTRKEPHAQHDSLGKCVANTIKRWKFPRSADSVTVDYPFIFTPAK